MWPIPRLFCPMTSPARSWPDPVAPARQRRGRRGDDHRQRRRDHLQLIFVLEWGAGYQPVHLEQYQRGASRRRCGTMVLGVWNTTGLPEGPYVLRLTRGAGNGELRQVLVPVVIASYPSPP